jgi:hypothetical protein
VSAALVRDLRRASQLLRAFVPRAEDRAMVSDPVRLFEATGAAPDEWQVRALRSAAPRLAFNVTRQGGKSSVAAALAGHQALGVAGSLSLLVSPSLRQSGELFRKVLDVYRDAGRPVAPETENKLSLELVNGSRIAALPGKEGTIRGFSGVDLLIIDEAARVPDELYNAVRPMLAVSGGRLVTLSTPFGKRGWWHREWIEGRGWERYEIPASACPRISAEFLAEERAALGDWWYRQEYGCEFVETVDQVFGYELVMAALSDEVAPLFGDAA